MRDQLASQVAAADVGRLPQRLRSPQPRARSQQSTARSRSPKRRCDKFCSLFQFPSKRAHPLNIHDSCSYFMYSVCCTAGHSVRHQLQFHAQIPRPLCQSGLTRSTYMIVFHICSNQAATPYRVNRVSWSLPDGAMLRAKSAMTIMAEAAAAMEHACQIAERAALAFKDQCCERFDTRCLLT